MNEVTYERHTISIQIMQTNKNLKCNISKYGAVKVK